MAPLLARYDKAGFWFAAVLTGSVTGLSTVDLFELLPLTRHFMRLRAGISLLPAASTAPASRHLLVLLGAGIFVAIGQLALTKLSGGNSIDLITAIWF